MSMRETYYAAHHAARKTARDKALRVAARYPVSGESFRFESCGVVIVAYREARGRYVSCEPARVYHATIVDRAPRQRIAQELAWAASYRRDLARAGRDTGKRQSAMHGALACIVGARQLQTAFMRIPS